MDGKIKVLFVDDDILFGNIVKKGLTDAGFEVYYASSLLAIESIINVFEPSIAIFDVEVGDDNGIDVFISLHKVFENIPFIFISSHIEEKFSVRAIENGGCLYLKKPIKIKELIAYISRHAVPYSKEISCGDFVVHGETREIKNINSGKIKKLSIKEFETLKMLIKRIGRDVPREEIAANVWRGQSCTDQALNNVIAQLRRILSSDPNIRIITIQKVGYKMLL